jgi:uncharacterized protein (DUF1697 family)
VNQIALLRAVNVGGVAVSMSDLRAWLESLGFTQVRTLLQSGNCIFRSRAAGPQLERQLEEKALASLGLRTKFVTRTAAQWSAMVRANPMPELARQDPSRFLVVALKGAPAADAARRLIAQTPGGERIGVDGNHAYIYHPEGIARTKLTLAVLEKRLGTVGTARNWNTVLKIEAAANGSPP